MAKARSKKSVGFFDEAVNFVQDTARQAKEKVEEIMTPDEGTLVDKLKNRKEYQDKQIEGQTTPPAPPPEKTTPQTKNTQLAADEKKSKKLTKKQVEEIRQRLQSGEQVKTAEYE